MKKVLIVEDEAVIREAFAMLLEANQYDVTTSTNGKEALDACRCESFNVILLDLMMPEMDGAEFLRVAKEQQLLSKERIVVLSNLSTGKGLSTIKELGAHRHEIKSNLSPTEIVELVRSEAN